jgi:alpha-amylase/alpha-mannosidase (GH57 family)
LTDPAADPPPLDVVLCWHMHQPWYLVEGSFSRPWVYLHALKDYCDMAAHLEAQPRARAVVNFVPTLIEQIEAYAAAFTALRERGETLPDPLLAALAAPRMPEGPADRSRLAAQCLEIAYPRARTRFAPLARLVDFCHPLRAHPDLGRYLSDLALGDLLVWSHLAWIGEFDLAAEPLVDELIAKGGDYDRADRHRLLAFIDGRVSGVLGRYRTLAERGTVELAMSPWAHPILPLLLDFGTAREATPQLELPPMRAYPGGAARAHWHFEAGRATFERVFARAPAGCWPPEAAISDGAIRLIAEHGFVWTVSSGAVLRNSLGSHSADAPVHRTFAPNDDAPRLFFRDDGLSDLIGFVYKDWAAETAVDDLIHHLETIAAHEREPGAVVTIALDGENAWEHFPRNGHDFLAALYRRLAEHPRLRLTTFSEHLRHGHPPRRLGQVVTGSWVHGSLTTWIGHPDKNRAWMLLADAKRRYDALPERTAAVDRALGICEGSDWFWWLGDVHGAAVVRAFDSLYRAQLRALYRLLGEGPPPEIDRPLGTGAEHAAAFTMLPTGGGVSDDT